MLGCRRNSAEEEEWCKATPEGPSGVLSPEEQFGNNFYFFFSGWLVRSQSLSKPLAGPREGAAVGIGLCKCTNSLL